MSLDSTQPSTSQAPTKTVSAAISLLQSLKPRITEILGNEKLRVALNRMDIMKPNRGDLEQAHVLWVGPHVENDDAKRLRDVAGLYYYFLCQCVVDLRSEMIRKAFLDADLVVNEKRPLKV
jgi:activating signal cointegrator complex subunit 1